MVTNRSVLQIPIDKTLKSEAEKVATEAGFSSVQEVVRIFLTNFAKEKIMVNFTDSTKVLADSSEKRYTKMVKDIKNGENIANKDEIERLSTF